MTSINLKLISKYLVFLLLVFNFTGPVHAQEFCARLFTEAPASSNISFLLEPTIHKNLQFSFEDEIAYFKSPKQNMSIISQYTGNLHKLLNSELGKKNELRNARYLRIMDRLNEALSLLPSYIGETYSGAALMPETFESMNLIAGKELQFDTYLSTTKKKNIANIFIKHGMKKVGPRIPVLFVIDGKNGKDITRFSYFKSESEILFKPGTKFYIKSIEEPHEGFLKWIGYRKEYIVRLEEVDNLNTKIEIPQKGSSNLDLPDILEAQRLYDVQDWQKALKERPHDPWNFYGEKTYQNWKTADQFLKNLPQDQELNWDLIEKVHSIAMKDHPYIGWQRRKVRERFRKNLITESQALDLLNKIDQGETVEDISNVGSRQKNGDFFTHSGDNETRDRHRYFTKNELELFLRNPFFSVDNNSIKSGGAKGYLAEIHYVYPHDLSKVLKSVIREANSLIADADNDSEYLWGVVKLEHALLSIHPFSDGNGRTIRLIGDWLLRKRNLPIPQHPITTELNMTLKEYYQATIQAI